MWPFKFRKKYKRRSKVTSVTRHYLDNRGQAKSLVLERLAHFNLHYRLSWNRVSIKNQSRCWGSCTSLKNLNFNYKLLLLPPYLRDYIIVHELCHLKELNHSKAFWDLVAEQIPEYRILIKELKNIDSKGHSVTTLLSLCNDYVCNEKVVELDKT